MFDPGLSLRKQSSDTIEQPDSAPEPSSGAAPTSRAWPPARGRTMNVSPLDLRQQRFRTTMRGFDKIEVTSFLMAVADDYEQALRETDQLRQDLARMEVLLSGHREAEKSLQATLITAQKLADDIRAGADDEGRRIVREAQERADLLLEKAQARVEDVQREIDGLKLKRRDVETTIESTIQALRNTLEFVREQEAREREDKILLHRPRQTDLDSRMAGLQEALQEIKSRSV
jgi:cell division initiation protein